MDKKQLQEFHAFARNLVKKTGSILLSSRKNLHVLKQKDIQDVCTTADIASETYSIEAISHTYPTHGIFSEEKGAMREQAEFRWVIDPLDGTKEYVRDIPLYNSSVALEYQGKVIVSAVYRPSDGVLYSAYEGGGAYKSDEKISVSQEKDFSKAFVYCYLPSFRRNPETYTSSWNILGEFGKYIYRLRAMADENTGFCWLAQGGCEACIDLGNPQGWYDVAPGLFIAKEAGATLTNRKGETLTEKNRKDIVVSNGYLHEVILQILQTNEKEKSI